jgi:hypothetical protein
MKEHPKCFQEEIFNTFQKSKVDQFIQKNDVNGHYSILNDMQGIYCISRKCQTHQACFGTISFMGDAKSFFSRNDL